MDCARIVCSILPLVFRIKKLYMSDKAKQKIRGGAIIAANHTRFSDPFFLGSAFWYRRMFFLAAEVVMKNKFLAPLLKGVGCIEINRNICDINSVRKSVSVLKEGHILSIFPQGGINREADMSAIKSGIALMAMQANVPVIPVYVHYKEKRGDRNCIVIGEEISLGSDTMRGLQAIEDFAAQIFNQMTECKAIYEKYAEVLK